MPLVIQNLDIIDTPKSPDGNQENHEEAGNDHDPVDNVPVNGVNGVNGGASPEAAAGAQVEVDMGESSFDAHEGEGHIIVLGDNDSVSSLDSSDSFGDDSDDTEDHRRHRSPRRRRDAKQKPTRVRELSPRFLQSASGRMQQPRRRKSRLHRDKRRPKEAQRSASPIHPPCSEGWKWSRPFASWPAPAP